MDIDVLPKELAEFKDNAGDLAQQSTKHDEANRNVKPDSSFTLLGTRMVGSRKLVAPTPNLCSQEEDGIESDIPAEVWRRFASLQCGFQLDKAWSQFATTPLGTATTRAGLPTQSKNHDHAHPRTRWTFLRRASIGTSWSRIQRDANIVDGRTENQP